MEYRLLHNLYIREKKSVAQIAKEHGCSQHKVDYWLRKHAIEKRTISDAIYQLKHPEGNPFLSKNPETVEEYFLFGLGLGLYWGEGQKRGRGGVRLSNTDVKLIKKFIQFLDQKFNVKKDQLKFGLQIFNDISPSAALSYWKKELGVKEDQFYKVIVSKVRGLGTYKYKSEYGVVCVYFNNVRLRQIICEMIENIV